MVSNLSMRRGRMFFGIFVAKIYVYVCRIIFLLIIGMRIHTSESLLIHIRRQLAKGIEVYEDFFLKYCLEQQ